MSKQITYISLNHGSRKKEKKKKSAQTFTLAQRPKYVLTCIDVDICLFE